MALNEPKPGKRETAEKQMQIKLTPSQWKRLENVRGDVPRSTFFKKLLAKASAEITGDGAEIPIAGLVCGGPGFNLGEVADYGTVRPPFTVPRGSIALLVTGTSMVSLKPNQSMPPGSYVVFRPESMPDVGDTVYAQVWDETEQSQALLKVFGDYGRDKDGDEIFILTSRNSDEIREVKVKHARLYKVGRHWEPKNVTIPEDIEDVRATVIANDNYIQSAIEAATRKAQAQQPEPPARQRKAG